jgi:large subunit ribosomal protein L49
MFRSLIATVSRSSRPSSLFPLPVPRFFSSSSSSSSDSSSDLVPHAPTVLYDPFPRESLAKPIAETLPPGQLARHAYRSDSARAASLKFTAQASAAIAQQAASPSSSNTAPAHGTKANPYKYPLEVPFKIRRTASNNLPVYLDYKNSGSRVNTYLKGFEGDEKRLFHEVQVFMGPKIDVKLRPGRIEIKGDHVEKMKKWLEVQGW